MSRCRQSSQATAIAAPEIVLFQMIISEWKLMHRSYLPGEADSC
jgi:hypothetical protein